MWCTPTQKQLAKLPDLYATEGINLADKKVFMHFFIASADWYMVEYDSKTETFFGYANLGNDELSEWGYISFKELKSINLKGLHVERDMHWKVRKAGEIKRINCYQ
jgi:hypothetical protein